VTTHSQMPVQSGDRAPDFVVPAGEHFAGDDGAEVGIDVEFVDDVELVAAADGDEAVFAAVGDVVDGDTAVVIGLEVEGGAGAPEVEVAGHPALWREGEGEDGVVGGVEELGGGLVGELVEGRDAAGEGDGVDGAGELDADAGDTAGGGIVVNGGGASQWGEEREEEQTGEQMADRRSHGVLAGVR